MGSLKKAKAFWIKSELSDGIAVTYQFDEGTLVQFIPNAGQAAKVVAAFRENADKALMSCALSLSLTQGTAMAPRLFDIDRVSEEGADDKQKAFLAAIRSAVRNDPALAESPDVA